MLLVSIFLIFYIIYPGGKKRWEYRKKLIEDFERKKKEL